jgi:uncharacterized delta-60 repeat protein
VTLTRLTPGGQPDPGFGPNGQVTLAFDDGFAPQSVAAQPDGRLVVAGAVPAGGGVRRSDLIRVTPDGRLDPTFGTAGRVAASRLRTGSFPEDFPVEVLVAPTGRILLFGVGDRPEAWEFDRGGAERAAVTFSYLGPAGTPPGGLERLRDAALLADGRVVVVGDAPAGGFQRFAAARLMGDQLPVGFAVGADAGGRPAVFVPQPIGGRTVEPFPSTVTGGVRVAAADVNADGVADLVAGTGPGVPTRVVVLDGKDQRQLFGVDPFEAAFTGGVYVAAGDLNGDGAPEIVVTPDEGGGPRVRVFNGNGFAVLADFFGIDDKNFRGGARAAVGDVDDDGTGDLIVAAGFQGGPRVAGFSGTSLAGTPARLFGDFFAFEETLRNGVFLTAGDIDGDGFAEVIAGGGPGGGPRVTAFGGKALLANQYDVRANFFGGNEANRGGIRVAVKDLDGDNRADLLAGAGSGAGSRVTAYHGKAIAPAGAPPAAFDFDAFGDFPGGVFVG